MSIFFFKPVRKKAVIISLIASGDKRVTSDLNLLIIYIRRNKNYIRDIYEISSKYIMRYSRVLQSRPIGDESEIRGSASSSNHGLEGPRDRLSEYGVNYIVNNIKTSEAWLRFAKYYPPKYVRKRLLKLGYEINNRDYWENFVFRIKNNLTSHQQIGNDPNYRDFKVQLALYKKNCASLIIQKTYRLWKKQINSAKIIQHAVIKWLYQPGGTLMKQAKDRYYCVTSLKGDLRIMGLCPYQNANKLHH